MLLPESEGGGDRAGGSAAAAASRLRAGQGILQGRAQFSELIQIV